MMAALKVLLDLLVLAYLGVLMVIVIETFWMDRHRIKTGLQALAMRLWCARTSVWFRAFLARLGRV